MVYYEWDVEIVQDGDTPDREDGEILDHMHQTCYRDALALSKTAPEPGTRWELVLVRDDDRGRAWAYMEDGELPEAFRDAYDREVCKVPKRFIAEVGRG